MLNEGLQQNIQKLALAMTKDNYLWPDNKENFELEGNGDADVRVPVNRIHHRFGGSLKACVPFPWGIMIGKVNISRADHGWNIAWQNCTLTCIVGTGPENQVLLLHQPAFLFIPTNISEVGR